MKWVGFFFLIIFSGMPLLGETQAPLSLKAVLECRNSYQAYFFFRDFAPETLSDSEFNALMLYLSETHCQEPGVFSRVLREKIRSVISRHSKNHIDSLLGQCKGTPSPVIQREIAIILGQIPAGKPEKKYLTAYEYVWVDGLFQDDRIMSALKVLISSQDLQVREAARTSLKKLEKQKKSETPTMEGSNANIK